MNIEFPITDKMIEDIQIQPEFRNLFFIVEYSDNGSWSEGEYLPEILIKSVSWSDDEPADDLALYFIHKIEQSVRKKQQDECPYFSEGIKQEVYKMLDGESFNKAAIITALNAAKADTGHNDNSRAVLRLMHRNGIGGGDATWNSLLNLMTA